MMKQIEEALKIIKEGSRLFGEEQYQSIYMFATENLNGVMNTLDVEGKDILTVSGSGDHIFNMLLRGAKSVEAYDINLFSKYYFYFKESAIRTLTRDEFIHFFFGKNYSFKDQRFNEKVYFEIVKNIKDSDSKFFFDVLGRGVGSKKLFKSELFFRNYYSKDTYIECNDYLRNEENYKKLQQILESYNYKFYRLNIFKDISDIGNKKYDIIYLSNILDRIIGKDKLETIKRIKKVILKLKKHLVTNGTLAVCYLYNYLDDYWSVSHSKQICNPNIRRECFNEKDGYIQESFMGVANYGSRAIRDRDALMLIKERDING